MLAPANRGRFRHNRSLCVGPANSGASQKAEFFSDRERLCASQINISVGCILVFDGLRNEWIICSVHSARGDCWQVFLVVVVRRQYFCFEVKNVYSGKN